MKKSIYGHPPAMRNLITWAQVKTRGAYDDPSGDKHRQVPSKTTQQ